MVVAQVDRDVCVRSSPTAAFFLVSRRGVDEATNHSWIALEHVRGGGLGGPFPEPDGLTARPHVWAQQAVCANRPKRPIQNSPPPTTGGDPSQERNDVVEVTTSSISSLARLPWGSKVATSSGENTGSATSAPTLQLYEFEACPFCRRVREAMTELDLSAEVYPCPKGSRRHREMVKKIGGKEQFPLLVDASTGVTMYESGDIVNYLFRQYGQGRSPSSGLLESTIFTGWVPTLLRAGRGMTLWNKAGVVPAEKLELFSYENNSYARIVREALCELELPYVLQNVGEGSSKMDALLRISGSEQVPYLIDLNTGFQSGDYKKILSYLFQQYSIGS
ncbi:uncharacterized protein C2845_PM16G08610 [Panicum miliaceum]|uniref:GST N-terminal domain-containing protein n=1 Tax=Panicum miliaceum TaxID=4540 RepID=A0A3L6PYL7_PANMI|nr:uncharacterized protein C2845_PM16G08610 [Panicum miliaceum]